MGNKCIVICEGDGQEPNFRCKQCELLPHFPFQSEGPQAGLTDCRAGEAAKRRRNGSAGPSSASSSRRPSSVASTRAPAVGSLNGFFPRPFAGLSASQYASVSVCACVYGLYGVCLCVCLFVCLFACLLGLFVCFPACLFFVCLFVCLCVCVCVCLCCVIVLLPFMNIPLDAYSIDFSLCVQ